MIMSLKTKPKSLRPHNDHSKQDLIKIFMVKKPKGKNTMKENEYPSNKKLQLKKKKTYYNPKFNLRKD